jgi:hypothetical protein
MVLLLQRWRYGAAMLLLLRGAIAMMALLLHGVATAAWPCCYATLLLCGVAVEICLFYFFYLTALGQKMRAKKRKKSKIRNLFLDFIG